MTTVDKQAGDTITVHVTERIERAWRSPARQLKRNLTQWRWRA